MKTIRDTQHSDRIDPDAIERTKKMHILKINPEYFRAVIGYVTDYEQKEGYVVFSLIPL